MDRLSSVIGSALVVLGLLLACDSKPDLGPVPKRVIAVKAKPISKEMLAGFCDVLDSKNRLGNLPPLDKPQSRSDSQKPHWINIWATWCGPCIEEMPRLRSWQKKIESESGPIDLDFISVDESADTLVEFLKSHPQIAHSNRLKNPDDLSVWIKKLGLDSGAGLPIHIFADASGSVKCVRAAAISQNHFGIVKKLIESSRGR